MRMGQLSLQQMPELQAPMGFFRTAPWFGMLAGLALVVLGPSIWLSRWMPGLLATAHLLLLGCIVMTMMGALVQVLPVISSARVPGIERSGGWIRGCLGSGAATLALALNYQIQPLYGLAGAFLLAAFGLFLGPLLPTLARRIGGGDAVMTLRAAVLCLLVTVGFGLYLALGHLAPEQFSEFRSHTATHIRFGLVGWMVMLIMALSFQVLPMFHVAPDYPRWISRGVPPVLLIGLVFDLAWLGATACAAYAVMTMVVLGRRKRRAPDISVRFWQLAAVILLLLAGAVSFASTSSTALDPRLELCLGTGFVVGFVLTVMVGMLYKIVPFLVFSHLQRRCLQDAVDVAQRVALIPTMHAIVPPSRAKMQLGLHLLTLALAITAPMVPMVGPICGLSMVLEFAWLAGSLRCGWSCYRSTLDQLARL